MAVGRVVVGLVLILASHVNAAFAPMPHLRSVRFAQPHMPSAAAFATLPKKARLIGNARTSNLEAKMVAVPPTVRTAASTLASLGALVGADVLLRRAFLARAIPFPSSLASKLRVQQVLTPPCPRQASQPCRSSSSLLHRTV